MPPTRREEFEIAIICALTLEADAVEALFDETYENFSQTYEKRPGDTNEYINGRIGRHNVVLCFLPGMGIASAATVTANLQGSYPRLHLVLVVGICGAIPFLPGEFQKAEDREIILGDVIISDSVIQYDFGRQYASGFKRKDGVKDTLGRPNTEIRGFLTRLKGRKTKRALESQIQKHLESLESQEDIWKRPDSGSDVLFEASYHHMHYQQEPPDKCICSKDNPDNICICDEAIKKSCTSLGCSGKLVHRVRYGAENSSAKVLKPAEDVKPLIRIGSMASANTVMKSGLGRDKLAEEEDVIGFEMEGAGAWDNGACVIIKGVCDYADSHKSKKWQDYAAATAASCMKAVLDLWTPRSTQISSSSHETMVSMLKGIYAVYSAEGISQSMDRNEVAQTAARYQALSGTDSERYHQARLHYQLKNSTSMPMQVPCPEMVIVNDALGETFKFSPNMIDSLEFFVIFLKRKFQHVGLGKIERREWMLQDHHTGHVLDLNRHWRTIIKAGRTIDMSMTFIRIHRQSLSTVCPWCETENESSLAEKHIMCQHCRGSYRRIEEISDVGLQPASTPLSAQNPLSRGEDETGQAAILRTPPPKWNEDESNDIHLYRRVQIVKLHFRLINPVSDKAPEYLIMWNEETIRDANQFTKNLADSFGFSNQECSDLLQYAIERRQKQRRGQIREEQTSQQIDPLSLPEDKFRVHRFGNRWVIHTIDQDDLSYSTRYQSGKPIEQAFPLLDGRPSISPHVKSALGQSSIPPNEVPGSPRRRVTRPSHAKRSRSSETAGQPTRLGEEGIFKALGRWVNPHA